MSHQLTASLSPEEQQRIMNQTYALMEKQVQSYHKYRRMGNNSSVPVELAQELMESIEYTVNKTDGVSVHRDMEEALRLGQEILLSRLDAAKALLELVNDTAPRWQTECRWDALCDLRRYLTSYDYLHLAHRSPDELFYPIPIPVPDNLRGIDYCLFYLRVLWAENQIMAGVDDEAVEVLWDCMPADLHNPCEQLLINGLGKAMLYDRIDGVVFREEDYAALTLLLQGKTAGETQTVLQDAAVRLCAFLELTDGNAVAYVKSVAQQLQPRLETALSCEALTVLFLGDR